MVKRKTKSGQIKRLRNMPDINTEIVFSFDTTGSMSGCIAQVRGRVKEVIQRLLGDIKGLRIAVVSHGDYCDGNDVIHWRDFTRNADELCQFITVTPNTTGGDWPECYELVLNRVAKNLSWCSNSQKALVMIGDAVPHPVHEAQNIENLDWRKEADSLFYNMDVRIYAVQCLTCWGSSDFIRSREFWSELAERTAGRYLAMEQFTTVVDFILAICYREQGQQALQKFEEEVRSRGEAGGTGQISTELEVLFHVLKSPRQKLNEANSSSDSDALTGNESDEQLVKVKQESPVKKPKLGAIDRKRNYSKIRKKTVVKRAKKPARKKHTQILNTNTS